MVPAEEAGYTRRLESLFRVLRRLGFSSTTPRKEPYKPKPYEQMTYPGQRVQVDVKVVPQACITDPELRLFQYTAIDEFSRLRFLWAYEEQSTYSSADFLKPLVKWYRRRGITVECVQPDNGFEFTNRFSNSATYPRSLTKPPLSWPSATSSFAPTRQGITARWNEATARTSGAFMSHIAFSLSRTSPPSLPSITHVPTTDP